MIESIQKVILALSCSSQFVYNSTKAGWSQDKISYTKKCKAGADRSRPTRGSVYKVSTRSPIQVPEELKSKVDNLKDQFNTKTHYEVIEKLIESYHAFNRYKEDQRIKMEEEKERQLRDMIDIGPEIKTKFNEFKSEMRLTKDSSAVEILLHHYGCSSSIEKSTFALYQSLK